MSEWRLPVYTEGHIIAGMNATVRRMAEGEYDSLNQECLEAYNKRPERPEVMPALVPAGQVLLDMTLGILAVPGVISQLPREVARRERAATMLVQMVVDMACQTKMLYSYYANNPILRPLLKDDEVIEALTHNGSLNIIAMSPFDEVSASAGGAYRFLLQNRQPKQAGGILRRSDNGLLLTAGITQGDKAIRAGVLLGRPYIAEKYYEMSSDVKQRELVRFNDNAREIIRSLSEKGRGCPARNVHDPSRPDQPLIHKAWKRIVGYLFLCGATVNEPNKELKIKDTGTGKEIYFDNFAATDGAKVNGL